MKISKLLELRDNLIAVYDTDSLIQKINELVIDLSNVKSGITDNDSQQQITNILTKLLDAINNIQLSDESFNTLIDSIKGQIKSKETGYFKEDYQLSLPKDPLKVIREHRVLYVDDNVKREIEERAAFYTDWKYPALEICCRDGALTKHMVAADPLYVIEHHKEFIDSTLGQFPEAYQRRIRPYLVSPDDALTDILPKNQFGFVLCWNFLNYENFVNTQIYLKSIFELLRPGGVFMFSYNDGDSAYGAAMAESMVATYIPTPTLIESAKTIGYEIVTHQKRNNRLSWIEIKKPGALTTNKAHQVMGEINHITP
jgi:SAM-dependent methyltransferase